MRLQRDREQPLPHLELKNALRGGEQKRRFHRNATKSASCGQVALAATRSRVTVVRFQRRHARRKLRLARGHAVGRAELHLRSGFRRRHACQNGRVASSSASLTRRNFAWGSLASGNFARGSYTGGIITSTSARHLHQRSRQPRRRRPRLHQDQRLHHLLWHQRQLTDTPIAVPWESNPPLRAAEPQAFFLYLSLHVTGEAATTAEQLWWSFLRWAHYSV